MNLRVYVYAFGVGFMLILCIPRAIAQQPDSTDITKNDSFFLLKKKGLLGKLARSIAADTIKDDNLVRIDYLYRRYRGRVIRNI